jgi:5-methylcytosine-specific restriction endonuclease McrA
MQAHTKNYLKAMGLTPADFIPCEVCTTQAVDIHHVIPRSKFGKKRKAEQDHISNLIALCRTCHNLAHDNKISKEELQLIISKREVSSSI